MAVVVSEREMAGADGRFSGAGAAAGMVADLEPSGNCDRRILSNWSFGDPIWSFGDNLIQFGKRTTR